MPNKINIFASSHLMTSNYTKLCFFILISASKQMDRFKVLYFENIKQKKIYEKLSIIYIIVICLALGYAYLT